MDADRWLAAEVYELMLSLLPLLLRQLETPRGNFFNNDEAREEVLFGVLGSAPLGAESWAD